MNKISKTGQRPILLHANADGSSHTNEHYVEDKHLNWSKMCFFKVCSTHGDSTFESYLEKS